MAKILTAYFSASGVTASLAEKLARVVGADLYEIEPREKYSSADLDWTDPKSRSSVEMNDPASRPAIGSQTPDLTPYDTIFVGFPVWWYREPGIIDTFMESADFTGKTVVPFATSGMSPIGPSGSNMQKLAPGAKVEAGKRFAASVSEAELKKWAAAWL